MYSHITKAKSLFVPLLLLSLNWWASAGTPVLSPATIMLYENTNFGGTSKEISLNSCNPDSESVIQIVGDLEGNSQSLAFNIPKGYVVTFVTSDVAFDDLVKAKGIDLIGTGSTVAYGDLNNFSLGKQLKYYSYYPYDETVGHVKVYKDKSRSGNWRCIMPSNWKTGTTQSMSGWDVNNDIESMDWSDLSPLVYMTFFKHTNGASGGGLFFTEAFGWNSNTHFNDFSSINYDNDIESFTWDYVEPVKNSIASVSLANVDIDVQVANTETGHCDSEGASQVSITLQESLATSLSASTTTQWTLGGDLKASIETIPPKETGGVGFGLSVDFTAQYTHTRTGQGTGTTSVSKTITQAVHCPHNATADASLSFEYATIDTTLTTDVSRWYDVPIPGSTPDPNNDGLYKLDSTMDVVVQGPFAVGVYLSTSYDTSDGSRRYLRTRLG